MIKIIKEFFSDAWNYMWSKTTVDEKAVATVKEIKKRYKLTTAELADVAKAIKEVGNQLGDIDDAIKGKARKGRKTNMGKNAQNPKNMGNSKNKK